MQNLFRRLLFHYWYFRQPPWDTGISPPELLEFIENHTAGRAMDIGCGTGTNIITLARARWQISAKSHPDLLSLPAAMDWTSVNAPQPGSFTNKPSLP